MRKNFPASCRIFVAFFAAFVFAASSASSAWAASRIKDIVDVEGIRDNMLVGYGLVVGLNGTGDNLRNSPFTERGLQDFLSRLGYSMKGENLKTRNIAAVTVTGNLAPFARSGSRFDVQVSTLGDAKSLQGGILLATPMVGADGNVYAVAQGSVAIAHNSEPTAQGGVEASPTTGAVPSGAIVEREIAFDLRSMHQITLSLKNPDVSTSRRISERINSVIGENVATSIDPGTVIMKAPDVYAGNLLSLLADVEQIDVEPDQPAQVVIDEASGTVVISEGVKIDTVAISQGNLSINVNASEQNKGSAFYGDVNPVSNVDKNSLGGPGKGFAMMRQGANLYDLVNGLNALGVKTRDVVSILKTIKAAGALHAEIVVK
ncbi:MAG: flagellar basal body P-ring protein FlgI [Rickettsiales bacterium]